MSGRLIERQKVLFISQQYDGALNGSASKFLMFRLVQHIIDVGFVDERMLEEAEA